MKKLAPLCLLLLAISGCTGAVTGGLGIANSALTGALSGVAGVVSEQQLLEQYATIHNLKVQLEMIDTMGIVTTTTQTPVVITGTPMTPPAPVTSTPPVVVTPPVVTPPPTTGGPIVTPNVRHRRHSSEIEQMAAFDWDKWGRPVRADRDVLLH
jgi:hypothetical protein